MTEHTNSKNDQRCLICRSSLNRDDGATIRAKLEDGSEVYGHRRCIEGISRLQGQLGNNYSWKEKQRLPIREIEGEWVLTRHEFPNQYIPILIFLSLHGDSAVPLDEIKSWIELNDLDFSNPNVPIKRLVRKSSISVISDKNGPSKYFITEKGAKQLEEYLAKI